MSSISHPPLPTPAGSGPVLHPIVLSRKQFLAQAGLAAAGVALGIPVVMSVRSVVPNMLYEPPRRIKLGPLDRFQEGATFVPMQRLFVFRSGDTLYCVSAVCTHLGCTVQQAVIADAEAGFEFHCPCHGSKFRADGTNFAGPAPRSLDYFMLEVSPDDGQLIVDKSKLADKGWRLTVRG